MVISRKLFKLLMLSCLAAPGCEQALEHAQEAREINRQQLARESRPSKPRPRRPAPPRTDRENSPREDDNEPLPEIAASGYLHDPSPAGLAKHYGGVNEIVAAARLFAHVRDTADLDPTLVVWLFDTSPSASHVTHQMGRQLREFYTDIGKGRIPGIKPRDPEPRLLTAVVTFGAQVQFPLEEPTPDPLAVMAAVDSLPSDSSPREMTFAAIQAALEKYLSYPTERGRRLMLVVVTDEAGDDGQRVEEVLAAPRKYGVPVYVVGSPAPFGLVTALPNAVEGESSSLAGANASSKQDPPLRHGPESLHVEHVTLPSLGGLWRKETLESGFGPFALERLCRATGGEFIVLQPPPESQPGGSLADWPSPHTVRFEPDAMRRYAPDYVSEEIYQQRLNENGAKQTLHQAAALEPITDAFYPETEFPRGTEAELQRRIGQAQQTAARLAPQVDRLYEALQKGEADRAKLTEPRWQAAFDLALGRAAAAKARVDGYNAMLALLKRGRSFERAESTRWILEPSDTTEAGSSVERLMQKARTHLERVVQDHPGTPWARLAAQDLESNFGWKWAEQ
jgi:hypothetical protein